MRIANFRDDVLWAIAHKAGIDPDILRNGQGIMPDQADAWVSAINEWVRRIYPSADYPEWTPTNQFGVPGHIVPWDAFAVDIGANVKLDRVLKVYMLDPNTTWLPVDTPFRLQPAGVHVGFEHGSSVWLKYMALCPRFTAKEWEANQTYSLDQPTYSPRTGQCYRSKTGGNIGHDPSFTFSPPPAQQNIPQPPIQLPTEIVVPLSAGNPGLAAQNQIVDVIFDVPIPDPPPINARFFVEVVDVNGALLGNATSMANGIDTLDLIVTDLSNQLISVLTGFTVTVDADAFRIRISDDSNFKVNQAFWGLFGDMNRNVKVKQIQVYIPVVAPVDDTKQVIQFPLSDEQVVPGAEYVLTFREVNGTEHVVSYISQPSDNAQQILSGLITAMLFTASSDIFLQDVSATLDTASPSDLFGTSTAISLGATMTLPGSPWWELVPFPMDLVETVVRGVTADHLKAEGQADKSAAEEQVIPQEIQAVTGRMQAPQFDDLTDQSRAKLPK